MITIGIQGGKGSFNEEACKYFCKIHDVKNYSIKYLYTTENVLSHLHLGKVDYAQFAIEDPLGGIVNESIDALTKYTCKIVDKFKYPINLHLLLHKDAKMEDIKVFMTHPQIYKQCKNTLKKKYPKIEMQFGKGEMLDQAKAAEKLSKGEIEKDIGIIGSKLLADIYKNLMIADENLEDKKNNASTFLFCNRRYIV
ncbi:MAG: prephenate dehydratase domain-containing protein [Patescibacteria group bacterium]|nr:hypothetical protein [Patescibacteria group bacterium]